MKIFEEQAQEKANREYRLLVIDGHNSHYTVALLLLARLHQIIVICYPAHGTHIYQGLDVVIFVILKLLLSKERDKLLRDTGKAINKSNFLSVITNTYRQALTPGNIKTAFRKTGIHPFNPDVVTPDMLAPSKETSLEANLPVETSDAAKLFVGMLHQLRDLEGADSDSEDADELDSQLAEEQESVVRADTPGPSTSTLNPTGRTHSINTIPTPTITRTTLSVAHSTIPSNPLTSTTTHSTEHTLNPPKSTTTQSTTPPTQSRKPTPLDILKETVTALKKTNLAYFTTHTTTTSSDPMPKTTTRTRAQVTAITNTTAAALTIQPTTSNELLLLAALHEAESRNVHAEVHAFELQASNILNEAYTERLRKALQTKEEKRGKKKGMKLVGDGLAKLLSGDEFYELAQAKEKEVREVSRQKEEQKEGQVAYDVAVEEWAEADKERKDEWDTIKANNAKMKAVWDKRKAAAVKMKKKFTELKPKSKPLLKVIPRPKLKDFLDSGGGVVSASEAGDDTGSDGDEVDDAGTEGSVSDDDDD
jgi:hypothetical protein